MTSRKVRILISVTILILVDGFLQFIGHPDTANVLGVVTILILVDGFLQFKNVYLTIKNKLSHNPYFSRWFSEI